MFHLNLSKVFQEVLDRLLTRKEILMTELILDFWGGMGGCFADLQKWWDDIVNCFMGAGTRLLNTSSLNYSASAWDYYLGNLRFVLTLS